MTNSRATLLAACATVLAVGALALDLPGDRTKWVTLATDHLTLISDGSPSKAREVAFDLERMLSALGQSFGVPIRLQPPTTVFLFGSADAFQGYCAALTARSCETTGGLFAPSEHAAYLLFPARRFEDARHIAYHELTHALIRNGMPSVPLWLDEGIAEFYGSFYASGGDFLIGRPDPEHLATLRADGLLPTARMLALKQDSPEFTSRSGRPQAYAQAWLMVHYIFVGSPQGRTHLGQFLARRGRGEADEAAFHAAFGVTPQAFDKELYGYLGQSRMAALRLLVSSVTVAEPGAPQPLPRDAALAALGAMLAGGHQCDPAIARPFLEAARRIAPGSARYAALLASVAAKQGRAEEAESLFAEAARLPEDATAALLFGEYILRRGPGAGSGLVMPDGAAATQSREQFERCLRLEPDSVAALVGVGNSYLVAPVGDIAPGIAAYEAALRLAPARPDAATGLAQLYARTGDPARAAETIARYLAGSNDPTVQAQLPELIAHLEAEGARVAMSRRDFAAAAAALERAIASAHDEASRTRLQAQLARVRETAALDSAAADFNAGRLDEASAALQRLIPTITDAAVRAQAEALRDRIAELKSKGGAAAEAVVEQPTQDPDSWRDQAQRRNADAQKEADRYNEAAALASSGQLVAALRIAEDLAAHATNAEVRKAAAGLRDRLRARLAGRG